MKIALLNLPIDNNYGGNLQRYALMKVLQDMGHDVTHISLYYKARLRWNVAPLVYLKRFFLKYILGKPIVINQEAKINQQYQDRLKIVDPFYNKYIKHTEPCYTATDIEHVTKGKYDAFVVGSDQCWRKDMNNSIGWKTFLFDFISDKDVKRIAYGASFGKETVTYNRAETREFHRLYNRFTVASVRESSGIEILSRMNCFEPEPQVVLDPTMLLSQKDYLELIENEKTPSPAKGKVFCYVLDRTDEIVNSARNIALELNTDVVFYGIKGQQAQLSIEMWLKCIYEASYIITDSYHGTVFSIIFNKPFKFCGNERRGNGRISSLFEILNIRDCHGLIQPHDDTKQRLETMKVKSIKFLKDEF